MSELIGISDHLGGFLRRTAQGRRLGLCRVVLPQGDDHVGALEVGKKADLAVLSQDPFAVAPEALGKTRVLETWVGGKRVYERAR